MYSGLMDDVQTCVEPGVSKKVPVFAPSEEFDYAWAWIDIYDCFDFEPLGIGTKGEGHILRATNVYLPAAKDGGGYLFHAGGQWGSHHENRQGKLKERNIYLNF
jgi:hypothetical protein